MGNFDIKSIFHTIGEYVSNMPEILNALFVDNN